MNRYVKRSLIFMLFVVAALCFVFASACKADKVTVTLCSETYEYTEFELSPNEPLPVVNVADKDFEGYWTDAEYTEKYESDVVPDKSITLYYKLKEQHYTMVLSYGDRGEYRYTFTRGVNEMLPELNPVGEKVVAYSLNEGEGADFLAGETVCNLAEKDGTVYLYAVTEVQNVEDFIIADGAVVGYTGKDTEITLPYSATKVAENAFTDNKTLVSVTVPNTYVSIEKGAFSGCEALETLTVPFIGGGRYDNRFMAYIFGADSYEDNVYSFSGYTDGSSLYMGNQNFDSQYAPLSLKTIRITDRVTGIPTGAFYSFYSLQNVVFDYPDAIVSVGDSAFESCLSLGYDADLGLAIQLNWLSGVKTIGNRAFATYTGDTETDVKVIYPYGEEYPELTAELIEYPYPFGYLSEISSLDSIEEIGDYAFYYAASLQSVSFGQNLKSIGDYAFMFCLGFTDLTFPDSLKTIGIQAFYGNSSVLNIRFGTQLEKIDSYAFADNAALSQVIMDTEEAPMLGSYAICNSLNVVGEDTDGNQILEMGFDNFSIYVKDGAAASFKQEWGEYVKYINVAGEKLAPAYWAEDGKNLDTRFDFTSGNIVYITDPQQAFISSVDYWNIGGMTYGATCGTYYPMVYEIIGGEEYAKTAAGQKDGKHAKPLYANQTIVHLWHPELLDYDGTMLEDLYFIITLQPYEQDGTTYLMPVLQELPGNIDYGNKNQNGTYIISYNAYGIPQVEQVEIKGGIPSTVPVADPEGTYYSEVIHDGSTFTVTYYAEDYSVLKQEIYVQYSDESYVSFDTPIYKKSDDFMTMEIDGSNNGGNSFMLDGRGGAVISINNGNTKYKASVLEDVEKKYGEEGFTITFKDLTENGNKADIAANAVFYDYFEGRYSRIVLTVGDFRYVLLNITFDGIWYRYTYENVVETKFALPKYSSDLNDYLWRYTRFTDVITDGYITIYKISVDDLATTNYMYFREFASNGEVVAFGTMQETENGYIFIEDNGKEITARISDQRGSFTMENGSFAVDNAGKSKTFVHYVDAEDTTFALAEDFYGTMIFYYTVKTDGYGNMYFLDEHDDGICDIYLGTYSDYSSFPSATSTYYEVEFNGVKLDENGEKTDETIQLWFLYDFASLAAWSDDEADAQWYGSIASIYFDHSTDTSVVYDDMGYKLYEISTDVYGNNTFVTYDYTLDRNGIPAYSVAKNADIEFISVTDAEGNVAYYLAVDGNGVSLFSVKKKADGNFYVYKEKCNLVVFEKNNAVLTISVDEMEKLA